MREIILSDKDLSNCHKKGLLKDLKSTGSGVKILRGPRRLIRVKGR
jgi:hypothetical protein